MKKITVFILAVAAIFCVFAVSNCSRPANSSQVLAEAGSADSPDMAISARASEPEAGLYAKVFSEITAGDTPIANVAANNIVAAFNYVNANPGTEVNPIRYTLLIDQDITSSGMFLGAPPSVDNPVANITIIGIGSRRTIQYNGPADSPLFYIGDTISGLRGRLTLGNNITLKGISNGENALINVIFGTLTMEDGSEITGHKTGNIGGAVSVYSTFEMNGGEISGNESRVMGGAGAVFVSVGPDAGNFTMNGGTITGNQGSFGAGGVFVDGNEWEGFAVFTMNGGTISGNTSKGELSPEPLDVLVLNGARFSNNGGTIGVLLNMQ